MPRLTKDEERSIGSIVNGSYVDKSSLLNPRGLSRVKVTNGNFWFTFYIDVTEGRVKITHEINTSYRWEDRCDFNRLQQIFIDKNESYLVEKFKMGLPCKKISHDDYYLLVLAVRLLMYIAFDKLTWKDFEDAKRK